MTITYKAVTQLVLKHGPVEAIDANGVTNKIEDDLESIELVEKTAVKYKFNDVVYSRKDFEKVLEKYL